MIVIKRILFCFFIFLTISITARAHDFLIFHNDVIQKTVVVNKNGTLLLKYKGYLGQAEFTLNNVIAINDSSLVLAKQRLWRIPSQVRIIMFKDILGFRKISVGDRLLQMGIRLAVTVAGILTITNNDSFNKTERILYPISIGLATTVGMKLLFPKNKIKYNMRDGWRILVQ